MFRMRVKYIYRLFTSHLAVLLVTLVLLTVSFNLFLPNFMFYLKEQELTRVGLYVMEQNLYPESPRRHMGKGREKDRMNIQVIRRSSTSEERQALRPPGLTLDESEWNQLNGGNPLKLKHGMNRFGLSVTVVVLPIQKDEALWLSAPITETEVTIKQARGVLFGTSFVTLGLVILVSWLLAGSLNRRIKTMRYLAQLVADGDFKKRVPVQGNDEISDLAQDLNRMAEMLDKAKQEADRYDLARSRFLADISHELKTPLTSIRGLLEALRNHLVQEEERERIYFLMEKETLRLIRLVQSVMELEKMRAGKMKFKMAEFPFYPVLKDIVEQMNILAEEKNLSLILEGDPETMVYGNEDRLRQVAINLIKNALQFTDQGEIRVKTWNEKDKTWLTVVDTGVGLTEEQSRDIFERFYKVDASRATTTGEMGLGLSMVKQIVQSHGGEVWAESEPGKGSKFILKIPLKK